MTTEFQRLAGRSAAQAELQRLLEKPPTRRNLSDFDRLLQKRFRGTVNIEAVGAAYRALWTRGPTGRAARRVAARQIVRVAFKAHPATRVLSWGWDAYNFVAVDKHARPEGFDEGPTLNYKSGTNVSFGTALGSRTAGALNGFVGLSPVPPGSGASALDRSVLLWASNPLSTTGRGTWIAAYNRAVPGPLTWKPAVKYYGPRAPDIEPVPAWWPQATDLPFSYPVQEPRRASWRYRRVARQVSRRNDPETFNDPESSAPSALPHPLPSQEIFSQPSPADDVSFVFPPSGPPSTGEPEHHAFKRPSAGEKEKKIKAKGLAAVALKWALRGTEANDAAGALYDAIPDHIRRFHEAQRPKGWSKAAWKLKGLWKYLEHVNGPQAMVNLLTNDANDKAVGVGSAALENPIGAQSEGLLRGIQKQQAMGEDVFFWTTEENSGPLPSSVRTF